MKIEKIVHPGYKVFQSSIAENINLPQLFYKWQYLYSSEKGKISLIKLLNYFRVGKSFWEIYCLNGKLFDDVERFSLKKKAEIRIKELLEVSL